MIPSIEINTDSEMKTQNNKNVQTESIDLQYYRRLVRLHIDLRRYKTALFWAEKCSVLSQYDPMDIYWQAQCMFLLREYYRAAHIITLRGLEKTNILCHYLVVESLFEAKEYQEAIELLNSIDFENLTNSLYSCIDGFLNDIPSTMFSGIESDPNGPTRSEILSSICLLKGKIFEAMDNRTLAMDCYVEALHLSVYCTEALDALVQHEMLLASEEKELITHLPVEAQCMDSDVKVIKKLYENKLKKYYESTLPQTTNANQTPIASLNTIKSILEFTEKTKTERNNSELKHGTKDSSSKLFTPIPQNILSPAHKLIHELKTTPVHSMQSSLLKLATPTSNPMTPNHTFRSQQQFQRTLNLSKKRESRSSEHNIMTLNTCYDRLEQSLDILNEKAKTLFYNCEYKECMDILENVLKSDPYHCDALIIFIGCLMELKEHNRLFCVAHKLVDLYSDQAISWYAVGCYYDLIGKSDPARRYLQKATSIDRLFGPAWLAYGHSFAKENEHDQAMAAYFKATQLMRGCHLPLLYIGVECGLTKNLDLAEKFFYQAMSIAPLDVFVLHELGVIKFEYEYYEDAEEIFRTTLNMVKQMAKEDNEPISTRWEPLINNLGHCCRKNKKFDAALTYHEQALVLKPQSAPTYSAIAFVHALTGNLELAVDYLHRSLALKRDDIFTSALLKSCLEDLMQENLLPNDIVDVESSLNEAMDSVDENSAIASPTRENNLMQPPTGNDPTKLRCMKITFDDDSNNSCSDIIDTSSLDISMDL